MKTLITIFVCGLLLFSCNTNIHHSDTDIRLELNNNNKWEVNPETATGY